MVKRVARIAKKRGICFFIIVDLRGGEWFVVFNYYSGGKDTIFLLLAVAF